MDGTDGRRVVGELAAGGEQALVDDVVEQGGFAGAGHAGERDETAKREPEGEVAEVVFGDALEAQPGGGFACGSRLVNGGWGGNGGGGNETLASFATRNGRERDGAAEIG